MVMRSIALFSSKRLSEGGACMKNGRRKQAEPGGGRLGKDARDLLAHHGQPGGTMYRGSS